MWGRRTEEASVVSGTAIGAEGSGRADCEGARPGPAWRAHLQLGCVGLARLELLRQLPLCASAVLVVAGECLCGGAVPECA